MSNQGSNGPRQWLGSQMRLAFMPLAGVTCAVPGHREGPDNAQLGGLVPLLYYKRVSDVRNVYRNGLHADNTDPYASKRTEKCPNKITKTSNNSYTCKLEYAFGFLLRCLKRSFRRWRPEKSGRAMHIILSIPGTCTNREFPKLISRRFHGLEHPSQALRYWVQLDERRNFLPYEVSSPSPKRAT